jgi:hypothetical protein
MDTPVRGQFGRTIASPGWVLSHRSEHRLGLGVRHVEVCGLGDFPFGVGDDEPNLLSDGRAVPEVVSDHGGAVAEQPQQRVGDGRLAGSVAADEAAHHR